MSDIACRVCGEPVEVYHVYNEMEEEERKKFLHGQGCVYCGFGTKCSACNGKGTEIEFRYVAELGGWRHVHTDEPCHRCQGTGKPTLTDAQYGDALYSLMNSDEDVSVYL